MLDSLIKIFPSWPGPKQPSKLSPRFNVSITHLPTELILAILQDLPLPSVLAFALTSKTYYATSIPVLNSTVIITQQNYHLFLKRARQHDPRNDLVRRVQVGRMDYPGQAEKWDIQTISQTILNSFSSLRELEGKGGTLVFGWNGLYEVGRVHCETLTTLVMKIRPKEDIASPKVTFPNLHTLQLKFHPDPSDLSNILPRIHARFPNVKSLSLHFLSPSSSQSGYVRGPYTLFHPSDLSTLLPSEQDLELRPYFRHLETFHIIQYSTFVHYINEDSSVAALAEFLARHASTLRDLTLPLLVPWEEPTVDLSSLRLRYLNTSYAMASYLSCPSHSPEDVHLGFSTESLEELHLFHLSTYVAQGPRLFLQSLQGLEPDEITRLEFAQSPQWRFREVKALTLRCTRFDQVLAHYFEVLPSFFPCLESLEFNLRAMESGGMKTANAAAWDSTYQHIINSIPTLTKVVTCDVPYKEYDTRRTLEFQVIRDESGAAVLDLQKATWHNGSMRPEGSGYWDLTY